VAEPLAASVRVARASSVGRAADRDVELAQDRAGRIRIAAHPAEGSLLDLVESC
jgi:hypothetical protein